VPQLDTVVVPDTVWETVPDTEKVADAVPLTDTEDVF